MARKSKADAKGYSIELRGSKYYLRFSVDGKPVGKVTPYKTLEECQKNALEFIKAYKAAYKPKEGELWTVGNLLDRNSKIWQLPEYHALRPGSKVKYSVDYKAVFGDYQDSTPLAAIKGEDIYSKISAVTNNNSYNGLTVSLNKLRNLMRRHGNTVEWNVVLKTRKSNPKVMYISKEEVTKLLDTYSNDQDMRLVINLGVHAGLRISEMHSLTWRKVNLVNKWVEVSEDIKRGFVPKSGETRRVPMKKVLFDTLKHVKKQVHPQEDDYLFAQSLRNLKEIANAKLQAVIPKCTTHILRHTFASHAVQAGVSIFKVSQWLGHHDVKITVQYYAHLAPVDDDIDKF